MKKRKKRKKKRLKKQPKESSTQIQDRFPTLQLADLFKKPLQINISFRRQLKYL